MKTFIQLIFPALLVAGCAIAVSAADPVVSNVRALQRTGTRLVDIRYDVTDADEDVLTVNLTASVTNHPIQTTSLVGDVNTNRVTPGVNRLITWDAGADWSGQFSTGVCFTVTANDAKTIIIFPTISTQQPSAKTNYPGIVIVNRPMDWIVSNIKPFGRYKVTCPTGGFYDSYINITNGTFIVSKLYQPPLGTKTFNVSLRMTDALGTVYLGGGAASVFVIAGDQIIIEQ